MTPEKEAADHETSNQTATDESPTTATEGQLSLPLETLAVLNWLGDEGIDGIESRLRQVPGDELTVSTEQVKIGYADQSTITTQFSADDHAGARILLKKPLKGNVLVVFPMQSANKAAALMLQNAVDDLSSVPTDLGRDALAELCNMMANGFVDKWSQLFDTTIDTGSPVALQNAEQALIHNILSVYEMGLYIASHLRIQEYDIDATVYLFPGDDEFVRKLSTVGLEVIQ